MERFAHILACTDFSAVGNRAIAAAFKACAAGHTAITLVHVLDPVPVPNPLYAHYYPDTSIDQESQAKAAEAAAQALEDLVPEAARTANVTIETAVLVGEAADEIVGAARKLHMDLIVVGTHGRRGLDRLVMGSVAERVMRQAPCAVLVVH